MVPLSGRVSPSITDHLSAQMGHLNKKKISSDAINGNISPRNFKENSLDPLSSRNMGNSFAKQLSPKTTKPISVSRCG